MSDPFRLSECVFFYSKTISLRVLIHVQIASTTMHKSNIAGRYFPMGQPLCVLFHVYVSEVLILLFERFTDRLVLTIYVHGYTKIKHSIARSC